MCFGKLFICLPSLIGLHDNVCNKIIFTKNIVTNEFKIRLFIIVY